MIKVLKPGIEIVVEDWPGRLKYMGLGMAAAGAMDSYAIQIGNLLVGNEVSEAGLEIAGGYCEFEFGESYVIALTGTSMNAKLNGNEVPMWSAFLVKPGDKLKFGHFGQCAFRCYLCVSGGIDVPEYLGSKSTCLFGSYGGYKGRKLQTGDEIPIGKALKDSDQLLKYKLNSKYVPEYTNNWELRAIPGPNAYPDYVTEKGMDYLFNHSFKISHNANRSAYRLEEIPDFFWARADGGKGGSHPSNIVDHGYNMRGALNVTGNTPSILVADGPTLGGFVCVLNVFNTDLWKVGQAIPSRDSVHFKLSTLDEAIHERKKMQKLLHADDLLIQKKL